MSENSNRNRNPHHERSLYDIVTLQLFGTPICQVLFARSHSVEGTCVIWLSIPPSYDQAVALPIFGQTANRRNYS